MNVVKEYDPFQTMGRDFDFGRILDGQIWRLQHSVDYDCPSSTMRNRINYHARKAGVDVRVMVRKSVIFVQALLTGK